MRFSIPGFVDCISIVNDVPDMYESFALIVVDCRDPDPSKDDRPVGGRCTGDKDEVLTEAEACEFVVGETCCARPHHGFVFVPVTTGLDYLPSDRADHCGECVQSILCWWVWLVKVQLFLGRSNPCVRRSGWVMDASTSPTHASGNGESVSEEQ